MAFRPDRTQPDFADLITALNSSANQLKDNPLYQTIFILLQRITTSRNNLVKQIEDIDELVSDIISATFLTENDESVLLINSRRVLAGTNISFDDSTPNVRIINSTGGGGTVFGGNTPVTYVPEEFDRGDTIEFMGNWPPESTPAPPTPGASGYWTPLTDGDTSEADLIFANGEAIAVFVPV